MSKLDSFERIIVNLYNTNQPVAFPVVCTYPMYSNKMSNQIK